MLCIRLCDSHKKELVSTFELENLQTSCFAFWCRCSLKRNWSSRRNLLGCGLGWISANIQKSKEFLSSIQSVRQTDIFTSKHMEKQMKNVIDASDAFSLLLSSVSSCTLPFVEMCAQRAPEKLSLSSALHHFAHLQRIREARAPALRNQLTPPILVRLCKKHRRRS